MVVILLKSGLRPLIASFRACVDNSKVNLSITDVFRATTFDTAAVVSSGACARRSQFGFGPAGRSAGLLSAAGGGSLLAAVIRNRNSRNVSEVEAPLGRFPPSGLQQSLKLCTVLY